MTLALAKISVALRGNRSAPPTLLSPPCFRNGFLGSRFCLFAPPHPRRLRSLFLLPSLLHPRIRINMASFVGDLWSSVFTPGPTPTLLLATNVTFAALQLVLFALLLGTHSIHFVVLSVLCAALWWSINWFAAEVRAVQAAEQKPSAADNNNIGRAVDSADSETETEARKTTPDAAALATGSAGLQLPAERDGRKRPSASGDSSGYMSTDSEWEKVEEH